MNKNPLYIATALLGLCLVSVSCSQSVTEQFTRTADREQTSFFKNENRPAQTKRCFEGAYYRKVVSSEDVWRGINGRVVLPELQFDEARINPRKPKQYLDNPSVYLGGSMGGQETDIGLSWEIVKDENGVVSAERKAFRPFLRRTDHASGQAAVFVNAPAESRYYWYPGEEVYMSVKIISEKKIRFVVEGAGKRFEQDFDCNGYSLTGQAEFKRVNAIDQVANEGKPAQASGTRILNSTWKTTNLYRDVDGKITEVPFHNGRYTSMACPSPSNFQLLATTEQLAIGAETISISGNGF